MTVTLASGSSAGLDGALARSGDLEARLATTGKDVRDAQALRYRVFFGANSSRPAHPSEARDVCPFDAVSDHLLVVDHAVRRDDGSPELVGVYRLLRQEVADRRFGFYSSGEFDLAPLFARWPSARFLEAGRACVAETHRGRHVLELLWRGLWRYARHYEIDALIGCASLPGTDPAAHAGAIRALAAGGDRDWRVAPRDGRAASLPGDGAARAADPRSLSRALPPLVKGYWRLGATFSPAPVIDPGFGTTDLFVVLPLWDVEPRYLEHFGVTAPPRPLAA